MAQYVVTDTQLTALADAIRAKAGIVGTLEFPSDFITAVGAIETGYSWEEVTISTAGAVTQALDPGKLYHFTGALTALTITLNAPASGLAHYHFDFNEPSTAFNPTLPSGVKLPDGNSWDASKHYEVDILNNYGAVLAWAAS